MLDANQLLWTKIAAGISLLLFAGFSWSVFRLRSRLLAANGWTVVDGAIIESRIDQPAEHFSDELSDASPIVRFRYQVGGRDFEGGKIDIGGSPTTTRVLATKKIAKYPVGLHVDVYVDPSDPASAVLEPRQSGNFVAVLTLAAIFGIAAIFLVVQSISERVAYTANGVPLFAFALPVVAIAVAVLAIVSFFQSRQLARASLAWPTTSGTIVQSEVMEERIEDPDNDNKSVRRLISRYQLDLRYRYRVGTRDYIGLVVNWGWAPVYGSREPAQAAASRFQPGQAVTVYYDPASPGDSVLEPASRNGSVVPLLFGLIFGAIGLGLLIFFIRVGFSN